jgi:hypothetical protein
LEELHFVPKPGGFLSADHMHTARDDYLESKQAGNQFSFEAQSEKRKSLKVITLRKCIA